MFDKLKGYVVYVLLAVVIATGGFGGYQYVQAQKNAAQVTVLDGQLEQVREDLAKAKAVNDANKLELDKLRDSAKVTENVTEKLDEQKLLDEKRYSALHKQVADQLKAIEARYKALEPSKENIERKVVEVSLARSRGVWLVYCNAVPTAKECANE